MSSLEADNSTAVSWRSTIAWRPERTTMTETSTPDPAENQPAQADVGAEGQDAESAGDTAGTTLSQLKSGPENQDVDLPGGPAKAEPTEPEEGAGI
jgi:hypothetical protein